MKIENTPENKARFFALYWGQDVFRHSFPKHNGKVDTYRMSLRNVNFEYSFLELIPLSQITDEDSVEVARLFNLGHLSGAVKSLVESLLESLENNSQATTMFIKSWIKVVDYLRSRGYYVGDGTEIEYGWVKLKEALP